jgi:hypothetical protein
LFILHLPFQVLFRNNFRFVSTKRNRSVAIVGLDNEKGDPGNAHLCLVHLVLLSHYGLQVLTFYRRQGLHFVEPDSFRQGSQDVQRLIFSPFSKYSEYMISINAFACSINAWACTLGYMLRLLVNWMPTARPASAIEFQFGPPFQYRTSFQYMQLEVFSCGGHVGI